MFPQFSPDGRYLFGQARPPVGDQAESVRIYDAKTWERKDRLPGMPDGVMRYCESPKSKRAVIVLADRILGLWDAEKHRDYARLDKGVLVERIAFSPDGSMVAVETFNQSYGKYWNICRIRIWKMDSGELVHELRPFEIDSCKRGLGLQWTSDGRYILAATETDHGAVDIWNVGSGRHRGTLGEGLFHPTEVVMLPDGSHVAGSGLGDKGNNVIRFWDFAAARKQIEAFEDSLAEPTAAK
jgi:WD40 repeat protein